MTKVWGKTDDMTYRWAALWKSKNKLDGYEEHIIYEDCMPKLFRTRKECRAWIKAEYGYIAYRTDLRQEPHGWLMPMPVKVVLTKLSDGTSIIIWRNFNVDVFLQN